MPVTTMADCTRGLLIGLLLTVAGCGDVSRSVERLHEIRVPVNPDAETLRASRYRGEPKGPAAEKTAVSTSASSTAR